MADQTCPPLGTGSVDFNALNDAAAKGHDLDKALEAATTRVEAPADEAADAPAPLTGRTKADLLGQASREGVIADETMTNAEIVKAIEDHRAALTAPADSE